MLTRPQRCNKKKIITLSKFKQGPDQDQLMLNAQKLKEVFLGLKTLQKIVK